MKKYKLVEIFYSIQGEGIRVGTPNIFIRFSHCNLSCDFCDTPYNDVNMEMERYQILEHIKQYPCKNIILTGGEPTLQLDEEIIKMFKDEGYYLAIESNGIKKIPQGIDYICVSPKSKRFEQNYGDELKYVLKTGETIPEKKGDFKNYLISPQMNYSTPDLDNLNYCIELIKTNPEWRLSIQSHKFMNIR